MAKQNVFESIKGLYKRSGMMGKLILVNLIVFLFIGLMAVIQKAFTVHGLHEAVGSQFAGPGNPEELLRQPWSLFTQMFTHFDFMHLAFNMLALYFLSRIFMQYFGGKRLLTTYLLGGIAGYLLHVGCYYTIPIFQEQGANGVVGASGAVMAIFMAVAFHRPKLNIHLFGLIKMPIIVLALIYVAVDFFSVGNFERGADGQLVDNVAHLAHLGGAIFGALSVINVSSPKSFMSRIEKFFGRLADMFKRKPKMKVVNQEKVKRMDDDQYRSVKANNQEAVDAILDKISKKGYEGLTKAEKEILFNESKKK